MKEIDQWLDKAEEDLITISNNLAASQIPINSCCFHAQQAAEKYFKAFLIFHRIEFPKTHDLILLIELCKKVDLSFEKLQQQAIDLSVFAIAPRYPNAIINPDLNDAKLAYNSATDIKEFVLNKF